MDATYHIQWDVAGHLIEVKFVNVFLKEKKNLILKFKN